MREINSLTIDCGSKSARYGKSVSVTPPQRQWATVHSGYRVKCIPGLIDPGEIEITGSGNHERLPVGKVIEIRLISTCRKKRLIASGFVRQRDSGPDHPTSIIKLDGDKLTRCVKRRGKWKVTRV